MKKLTQKLMIGVVMSTSILLTAGVQAKYIDKYTEQKLVKVCEAIKSNSRIKLDSAIKDSGISAKALGKGLVCNGYDPVTFAIASGAKTNAKFLANRTSLNYEDLLAKL
ncbi:DUF3718 domain-containing protein [Paraglaciecola aquimarina]|uniref:DUF3718 domain-containing protein n=1 Tax=Paraglaciecola algarum TaxID=3050085 RepID=A0ABS9D4T6_9ALTE|nr:DUF3718 domain-containing protein [Paraglaciecola sp. G1-23]MCF2947785.1 DUF3718 domain-containing protein [Paraglaciecola sp. G1-23]